MDSSTNRQSCRIQMARILQIRHKSDSDLILQESESDPILGDVGRSLNSLNPLDEM